MTLLRFLTSEFQSQISSYFCAFLGQKAASAARYPVSAAVFIPVLQYGRQETLKLCAEVTVSLLNYMVTPDSTQIDFQTVYLTELYTTCNQSSLNWIS